MAKKEDVKKQSEEIKNSLEDLSDVIKDLEKDLLKTFDFKRIDKFVDSLTESVKEFDKVSTYTEDIQKNLLGVDKSVNKLSKGFGSLKSNVDDIFKSIPTDLNIAIRLNTDLKTLQDQINSIQTIESNIKFNVENIELPKVEDIQSNIKFNVQDIEIPNVEDIQSNIKFNIQDINLPKVDDINSLIKYDIQIPDLPKIEDINSSVNYVNQIPVAPKIEDIQANIKYNTSPIEIPDATNIDALIKYNIQDIQVPEVKDIEASIKYNVQPIQVPEVKDIELNAKLNSTDFTELGKISDIQLSAQITSVDASLIDKTIYKYTPLIFDSIIDTPDTSSIDSILKKIPATKIRVNTDEIQKLNTVKPVEVPAALNVDTNKITNVIKDPVNIPVNSIVQNELSIDDFVGSSSITIPTELATPTTTTIKPDTGIKLDSELQVKLNKASEQGNALFKDRQDIINSIIPNVEKFKELEQKIQNALSSTNNLQEDLLETTSAIADQQKRIRDIQSGKSNNNLQEAEAQLKTLIESKKTIQNNIALEQTNLKQYDDIKKVNESTVDILSDLANNKKQIGKSTYETLNYSKELQSIDDQIAAANIDGNTILANALTSRKQLLQVAEQEAIAQDKLNSKIEASRDKFVGLGDKILNLIPGGKEGFLGKALGLDTISNNLKDKVGNAMANAFQSAESGMAGFFKAGIAGAGSLLAAIGPILPLILAIAGVVAIAKMFLDADKAVTQLAKDLGVTKHEAIGVREAAVSIANEMGMLSITSKEVTEQMVELKKASGINFGVLAQTNDTAKEFLETSTLITSAYGMTAEETMNLASAAAVAGGRVEDIVISAESMSDELSSASQILGDIAKLSKRSLEYFAKTPQALAASAKAARMLGTSLENVSSNMEQSLNFFDQLEASTYASILTGKTLNTTALSYYAHMKDGVNYLKEQKRLLPTIEEYSTMTYQGAAYYAKALGMSSDQLAEMMAQKKLLAQIGLSEEQMEQKMQKLMSGELDLSKEMASISDESARAQFKQLVTERQRQTMGEKISATMQKLTDTLYKVVGPLIEPFNQMLDSILESSKASGGLTDTLKEIGTTVLSIGKTFMSLAKTALPIISGMLGGISFVVGGIFKIFNGIVDIVSSIGKSLFGTEDATNNVASAAKSVESSMGTIKILASVIGGIIGLWFAKKMITGAIGMFQSIKGTVSDISGSTQNIFTSLTKGSKGFLDTFKKTEGGPLKKLTKSVQSLFGKKGEKGKKEGAPDLPDPESIESQVNVKVASFDTSIIQQELDKYKTLDQIKVGTFDASIIQQELDKYKTFESTGKVATFDVTVIQQELDKYKTFENTGKITTFDTSIIQQELDKYKTFESAGKISTYDTSIIQQELDKYKTFENTGKLSSFDASIIQQELDKYKTIDQIKVNAFDATLIQQELDKYKTLESSGKITAFDTTIIQQELDKYKTIEQIKLTSFDSSVIQQELDKYKTLENKVTAFDSSLIQQELQQYKTLESSGKVTAFDATLIRQELEKYKTLEVQVTYVKEGKKQTPGIDLSKMQENANQVKPLSERITKGFASFNQSLQSVFSGIGNTIKNIFNFLRDTLKSGLDFISSILSDLINVVKTAATDLVNALGDVGRAIIDNVTKLLEGLQQASGQLPGIMSNLGSAIGSFFEGLSTGLLAFGQAMAAPTPFGVPVGLIVVGMAIGLATAARIAAPAIAALGPMFKGLAEVVKAVGPVVEGVGIAIANVVKAIGTSVSQIITTVADSLVKLGNVNVLNIAAMALALPTLAFGLAALTAGSIVSGIASFLGAGPADLLNDLAEVDGQSIKTTSDAIVTLTNGLAGLAAIAMVSTIIPSITSALDDLSDVDSGDLIEIADSSTAMAESFEKLSASLAKLPADAVNKVKAIAEATGTQTSTGLLGSITSSIFGAIDKVKTGFSSVTSSITSSLTSGFDTAYKNVSDWFGQSPSPVGTSISKGIKSISGSIGTSLSKPFTKDGIKAVSEFATKATENISSVTGAVDGVTGSINNVIGTAGAVAGAYGAIKGAVSTPEVQVGDISGLQNLEQLKNLDVPGINDVINSLSALKIETLQSVFERLGDALDELDVDQLRSFGTLANTNIKDAAKSLQNGIGILVENLKTITSTQLLRLEDSFDLIEDAFDELDIEGIKGFASLAAADLKTAGKNFAKGINSLVKITQDISAKDLYALETKFDLIEDAFAELDIDGLKDFATLAETGLKSAAKSFSKSIQSLITSIVDDIDEGSIRSLETKFDLIEDAFDELNIEDIANFSAVASSALSDAAKSFGEGISSLVTSLANIDVSALSGLEDKFDNIEDAFDELDMNKLLEFGKLAENSLGAAADSLIAGITKLSTMGDNIPLDNFKNSLANLNAALGNVSWANVESFAKLAQSKLTDAADNLKEGITSLSSLGTTPLEPFKKALSTLNSVFKVVDWSMFTKFAELADKNLNSAALRLLDGITTLSNISTIKLDPFKNALKQLNDAFSVLDWDNVQSFAKLADAKLIAAGTNLIQGLEALASVKDEIPLDAIEESLENLNSVLGTIDWDNVESFAKLADSKLQSAALRLIDGIKTLKNGIDEELDLQALEDTLENLNDAFGEADWKAIETFASLADKDLNKAGLRLIDGINTLYNGLSQSVDMTALGTTLASLNSALKVLDWKAVDSFASLADKKLIAAATQLSEGISVLSKISTSTISIDTKGIDSLTQLGKSLTSIVSIDPKQIDAMAVAVNNLATSINSLASSMQSISDNDISKIKQVSEALPKPESPGVLDKIGGFFSGLFGEDNENPVVEATSTANVPAVTPVMQPTLTVGANQSSTDNIATAPSSTNNTALKTNDAELKRIGDLLTVLVNKVDRPVQFVIGDRVINAIDHTVSVNNSYRGS